MDRPLAIARLSALADETRLSVLGAVMRAGEEGITAGEIAAAVDRPSSSLSGPLRHLRLAGLVERRKHGKLSVYRGTRGALRELADFIAALEKQAEAASGLVLQPVHAENAGFIGLRGTLQKNNLPVDDLGGEGQRYFSLLDEGGTAFGYGGLEGAGADQLLRSPIIYPTARGSGMGRALVRLLEARAREEGAQRLWLLTSDAEKYFRRLGYKIVDRAQAPKAIARTKQFAGLCPASAKLMRKELR
ncbi:MAG: GNAT family N-acetyltransferase [Rhizobiales bacterium]|nr:GNAT family N-acetyltransferase [Hyphomicrobiales bacterium]